jgi:hypothetical protein
MGKLTETKHADDATKLLTFYQNEAKKLEPSGSYFMAAVALGAALETALIVFMLVEWDEAEGSETELPDRVLLDELIGAAKEFDLLGAIKFQEAGREGARPVEEVIHEVQRMRNNLHPGKALRTRFDPAAFDATRYKRLREIYAAAIENLLYHI